MNKVSRKIPGQVAVILLCLLSVAGPVFCKDKPLRILKVKVVADQDFAHLTSWERKAARRLNDIAEEVTEVLQVKMEIVAYERWEHAAEPDLYRLASQMVNQVDRGEADLLIGFTYVRCPEESKARHTDGVTIPYRGMIINVYRDRCWRNMFVPYVMIHEMVHAFGGVHVREKSLMTPVFADTVNLSIDRLNQSILRHTHDIDFRQGYRSLPRESLEKLAQNYQRAAEEENSDLMTRLELGKVLMAMDNYTDALSVFHSIADFDSTYTDAWINLSYCHSAFGRPDRAIEMLKGAVAEADLPGLVHYRLMELYLEVGDSTNARQEAAQALEHGVAVDSSLLDRLRMSGDNTD